VSIVTGFGELTAMAFDWCRDGRADRTVFLADCHLRLFRAVTGRASVGAGEQLVDGRGTDYSRTQQQSDTEFLSHSLPPRERTGPGWERDC